MPETQLSQITEHVYWMSPGQPDRPSLAAVVGSRETLMLDAGASAAHIRLFLDALAAVEVALPKSVALTHWHWDHVFGAAALGVPVIASAATTAQLAVLAGYDWSDAAIDARVAAGTEIDMCANDIKVELPAPRKVRIVPPTIVFDSTLQLHLGDVTVIIQQVGGDHAADSCVMYVPEDRVLFLGDCLYEAIYAPVRHYTPDKLLPMLNAVTAFDADHYIEGHTETVMPKAEFDDLVGKMRQAVALVDEFGPDEQAALAQLGTPPDEDTADFIKALIAGRQGETVDESSVDA